MPRLPGRVGHLALPHDLTALGNASGGSEEKFLSRASVGSTALYFGVSYSSSESRAESRDESRAKFSTSSVLDYARTIRKNSSPWRGRIEVGVTKR